MKEELRLLIELQKIDTDISKINAKKKDLPLRLARLEDTFTAFKATVQDAESSLEDVNKRHKEAEGKLKKAVEGLRKAKERLHEVKTNKEYNAVLKEIEGMEKKNGEIEEEIIHLFDEIDARKADLKVREQGLAEEQKQYEISRTELQQQIDAIASELQEMMDREASLRKTIPPDPLRKYETIKNIGSGIAVVSVWKELCDGCHMNIPPQMYNELFNSDELVLCPHCNRIIYWYDQSVNGA
ncbi:MAG: C4-type zinc ribbon domain-containing protein [Syntrophales bacterium]|nr:C4-type zinc ribbon domain-containing protein [Syntrophales bacterium]